MIFKKSKISGSILTTLLFLSSCCLAGIQKGYIEYHGEEQVELAGEWEFYWDTLFTNLTNGPTTKVTSYLSVPRYWNESDNKRYPTFGAATYRLIIYSD